MPQTKRNQIEEKKHITKIAHENGKRKNSKMLWQWQHFHSERWYKNRYSITFDGNAVDAEWKQTIFYGWQIEMKRKLRKSENGQRNFAKGQTLLTNEKQNDFYLIIKKRPFEMANFVRIFWIFIHMYAHTHTHIFSHLTRIHLRKRNTFTHAFTLVGAQPQKCRQILNKFQRDRDLWFVFDIFSRM